MNESRYTYYIKTFELLLALMIVCCLAASCRNAPAKPMLFESTSEPTSPPVVAMTVAPSPSASLTPHPSDTKKPLNPITFLAALIEQYEGNNRYALLSNITPVFERFGLDAAILDHYRSLQVGGYDPGVFFSEEDLLVQTLSAGLDGEIVAYTVLRLDVEGEGLALIFAREVAAVEWLFVDWFPCAEVGFTDNEVSFIQVWDSTAQHEYNWFLRVRGRRDHGTERQSIQTDWYDLTNKQYALGYMSEMIAMWGDTDDWLGNIITSAETIAIENGITTLTIDYSGMLVDRNDIHDWNDIKSVAFYAHDWKIVYALNSYDTFAIDNEEDRERMWPVSLENQNYYKGASIPAKDLLILFPDMQKSVEESGTSAQQRAFGKLLSSVKHD